MAEPGRVGNDEPGIRELRHTVAICPTYCRCAHRITPNRTISAPTSPFAALTRNRSINAGFSGGSLADIVARGPLSAPDAIARAIELASALALVHDAGIVHGDIKPANLFLRDETASSDLVLSDFGITGTLAYMPQEARTAQSSLSPASDIYATAVVLLEMLHGTEALAPLLRDSAAILRGTARWNEQLPPTLGTAAAPLRALILRMLADDSADRPRASDVHAALVELRDTTPT